MNAQENTDNKVHANLYGFVRNYFCYDTRQNLASSSEMFYFIPMDVKLNDYGDDLNATGSARLLAITTRLGLKLNGLEALGGSLSGQIEADFNGYSGSSTLLRIRQAFLKLTWTNSSLLIGQAWHPISTEIVPGVLGLATGAPFCPFSRTPQVRFNYYPCNNMTLCATALYQFQMTSSGPDGTSYKYARNAVMPELYLSARYDKNGYSFGVGVDYLELKPRLTGIDNKGVTVNVSDRVKSLSPIAFAAYRNDLFSIMMYSILASNTSHLFMMSGYGVTATNSDGSYDYSPMRSSSTWLNVSYGKVYKTNLYLGYAKNLGMNKDCVNVDSMLYLRGYNNIGHMFTFTPAFSYNLKHFNLGLEYNLTTVAYGDVVNDDATVDDLHHVTNHRLCMLFKYIF